jgi:2-dehydro-3-deoxyphosphooctonate aldolase (KDO 8-P synthase)
MSNTFLNSLDIKPSKIYTHPFLLIAGPCVIENYETTFNTARTLKRITRDLSIPFVFKASFDKANRTSIKSFRGPGFSDGIAILKKIKQELDIKVISDIHLPEQAEKVSKVLDIIQIPAFLCRQTDLISAACKTNRPVNIKKGQFLSPFECKNIINKAKQSGNEGISITERGTTFGYNNLVVDFRSIDIIRKMGVPIIFDATHSVQLPGAGINSSAGNREFVPVLSRAAIAAGADGLFIETHPDPDNALCDGPNSIKLNNIKELLIMLLNIRNAMF